MSNKSTLENPMPPLWMMYPHITQISIGWRMGYGEGYRDKFYDWFEELSSDEKDTYEKMFPNPKLWINYDRDNFEEDNFENYWIEGVIQLWNKYGKMKYSHLEIIERFNNGEKLDFVFFWKGQNNTIKSDSISHTINDNIINESCLSQWQYSEFVKDMDDYYYAEQYIMAEKARLFDDNEILQKIMESKDPKEIKSLGRKVHNFNKELWDKVKYSIVLNGNYYKFSQNQEMRNFLLGTGNKILVEASPFDRIWGIGIGKNNKKAHDPNLWRGENLLGFALMEVLDELKKVYKNFDKINWNEILENQF
jgi:ribA/ribD-fused uncharacterized protein